VRSDPIWVRNDEWGSNPDASDLNAQGWVCSGLEVEGHVTVVMEKRIIVTLTRGQKCWCLKDKAQDGEVQRS
jgi:hypothetical protein